MNTRGEWDAYIIGCLCSVGRGKDVGEWGGGRVSYSTFLLVVVAFGLAAVFAFFGFVTAGAAYEEIQLMR